MGYLKGADSAGRKVFFFSFFSFPPFSFLLPGMLVMTGVPATLRPLRRKLMYWEWGSKILKISRLWWPWSHYTNPRPAYLQTASTERKKLSYLSRHLSSRCLYENWSFPLNTARNTIIFPRNCPRRRYPASPSSGEGGNRPEFGHQDDWEVLWALRGWGPMMLTGFRPTGQLQTGQKQE